MRVIEKTPAVTIVAAESRPTQALGLPLRPAARDREETGPICRPLNEEEKCNSVAVDDASDPDSAAEFFHGSPNQRPETKEHRQHDTPVPWLVTKAFLPAVEAESRVPERNQEVRARSDPFPSEEGDE